MFRVEHIVITPAGRREPSVQAEDLLARGHRSGGLVQVQRPGLLDAHQPHIEKSDRGRQEADGKVGSAVRGSGAIRRPLLIDEPSLGVSKPDEPVPTPASIVQFRANRIQLSPSRRHHNSILCNSLAHQSLLDPIRATLRKRKIVDQFAS